MPSWYLSEAFICMQRMSEQKSSIKNYLRHYNHYTVHIIKS